MEETKRQIPKVFEAIYTAAYDGANALRSSVGDTLDSEHSYMDVKSII